MAPHRQRVFNSTHSPQHHATLTIPSIHQKLLDPLSNHDRHTQPEHEQACVAVRLPSDTKIRRARRHKTLDTGREHREDIRKQRVQLRARLDEHDAGGEEDGFEGREGVEDGLALVMTMLVKGDGGGDRGGCTSEEAAGCGSPDSPSFAALCHSLPLPRLAKLTSCPMLFAAIPPVRPPSAAHRLAQCPASPPLRTNCIVGSHHTATNAVNATTHSAWTRGMNRSARDFGRGSIPIPMPGIPPIPGMPAMPAKGFCPSPIPGIPPPAPPIPAIRAAKGSCPPNGSSPGPPAPAAPGPPRAGKPPEPACAMNCCMNVLKSGIPSGPAFMGSAAAARVWGVGVRPGVGAAHPGFFPPAAEAGAEEGARPDEVVAVGAAEVKGLLVVEAEAVADAVGADSAAAVAEVASAALESIGVCGALLPAEPGGEEEAPISSPYSLLASSPRAVCARRARPAFPRARILALRAAARFCASVCADIPACLSCVELELELELEMKMRKKWRVEGWKVEWNVVDDIERHSSRDADLVPCHIDASTRLRLLTLRTHSQRNATLTFIFGPSAARPTRTRTTQAPTTMSRSRDELHSHLAPGDAPAYLLRMVGAALQKQGFDGAEAGALAEVERLLEHRECSSLYLTLYHAGRRRGSCNRGILQLRWNLSPSSYPHAHRFPHLWARRLHIPLPSFVYAWTSLGAYPSSASLAVVKLTPDIQRVFEQAADYAEHAGRATPHARDLFVAQEMSGWDVASLKRASKRKRQCEYTAAQGVVGARPHADIPSTWVAAVGRDLANRSHRPPDPA